MKVTHPVRTNGLWPACLLPALLAPVAPCIGAEAFDPRFEVTPFVGYRVGGEFDADEDIEPNVGDVEVDDASSFGLIVNWPAEFNTEWEIYLSRQSTELDTDGLFGSDPPVIGDLDVTYLQAGGTYLLEGDRARPYIVATLGLSRFEPDDSAFDAENFFSFGIGGGYKIDLTPRFGLRLEARALGSIVDSDESVFCRSGTEVSGCRIAVSGSVLWQWDLIAGVAMRF